MFVFTDVLGFVILCEYSVAVLKNISTNTRQDTCELVSFYYSC